MPLAPRRPEVPCAGPVRPSAYTVVGLSARTGQNSRLPPIYLTAECATGECDCSFSEQGSQGVARYKKSLFPELSVGVTRATAASGVSSFQSAARRFYVGRKERECARGTMSANFLSHVTDGTKGAGFVFLSGRQTFHSLLYHCSGRFS